MQGLCLVAMKHLGQDREDITDAELDPRATYDGKRQRFEWPGKDPTKELCLGKKALTGLTVSASQGLI